MPLRYFLQYTLNKFNRFHLFNTQYFHHKIRYFLYLFLTQTFIFFTIIQLLYIFLRNTHLICNILPLWSSALHVKFNNISRPEIPNLFFFFILRITKPPFRFIKPFRLRRIQIYQQKSLLILSFLIIKFSIIINKFLPFPQIPD